MHVFVVFEADGKVRTSYPAELVEFDPSGIPAPILRTFQEALGCHAHNFNVAAAMMIRRTLEELCADRGATGDNLQKRIEALKQTVVLPPELIDGADALRLLGNDAAHVEARDFDAVGEEEVAVAIEFTTELLKAVYQYATLVGKFAALKAKRLQGNDGARTE